MAAGSPFKGLDVDKISWQSSMRFYAWAPANECGGVSQVCHKRSGVLKSLPFSIVLTEAQLQEWHFEDCGSGSSIATRFL